ncbi:MAG TPA: hypothetical protein VGD76_20670 [Ramlibacter sp.]
MKTIYSGREGSGPAYEIEADRHGSYTVKLAGKVVKRVSALASYRGKPVWGSRKLEEDAIEDAKKAIEAFRTHQG